MTLRISILVTVLCAAVSTAACGEISMELADRPGGGAAGSESGGGSAGRSGAPNAAGGGAGLSGADGGGTAGIGGVAGTSILGGSAGRAGFTPVDPQVSRAWRWSLCGSVPSMKAGAVQALFLPSAEPTGADAELAVLYDDGRILLHHRDPLLAPTVLRPSGDPLWSIAISADGNQLAQADGAGVHVRALSADSPPTDLAANAACAGGMLRFSAEGAYIVTLGQDAACVWRISDGRLLRQLNGSFASAAVSNGRLLTIETDSTVLSSWSFDGLNDSQVALQPTVDGATFARTVISPNGATVAAITQSSQSGLGGSLWSATGNLLASFAIGDAPGSWYDEIAYSASGTKVALAGRVVDIATGEQRQNNATGLEAKDPGSSAIDESGQLLSTLTFIANQFRAASLTDLRDLGASRVLGSMPGLMFSSDATPSLLAVSPDGTRLVTWAMGEGHKVLLWRVAARFEASAPFAMPNQALPFSGEFSADSRELILSGDGQGTFSAADGAPLAAVPPPPNVPPFTCFEAAATFSPRGDWVALGTYDAAIQIFTREGLRNVASVPTARCNERARFNSNGTLFATSGPELYRTDNWSVVWRAPISATKPSFDTPYSEYFRNVEFAPDEQTLLVSQCFGSELTRGCEHTLRSVATGAVRQTLSDLGSLHAHFSKEGNWIVSGRTLLHLPSNEVLNFAPDAQSSVFAPNGDIIVVRSDRTLERYCRTP